MTLFDNLQNIGVELLDLSDECKVNMLLYGNAIYDNDTNLSILRFTIIFLKSSERFEGPLF